MGLKVYFSISLFLLMILVSAGFSQDTSSDTTEDMEDIFDLSLEELMEIEVASTSKTPVAIERAPGTVYLFSGDALWDKGITTLEDLLRQIPGVQLVPSRLGHTSVWVRGVQGRYNSKLLLLIDGVPMRDFFYGNFTVDEMYPIEDIEKIEVLLGPGSTLYGSNAFAGVISITTKKKKNDVFGSIGSYDTYSGSAHATYGKASVFFKYLDANTGFSPEFGRDGKTRIYDLDASRQLSIFDFKYDLFENLTLHFNKTCYESPSTYTKDDRTESATRDPLTLSLNFTHGTPEEGKLDAVAYYVDYDYKRERYRIDDDFTPKDIKTTYMDTRYAGFDSYYTKQFNDHTFLLGTSFLGHEATNVTEIKWDISADPWVLDDYGQQLVDADKTYYDYAIYGQDQWKVTDKLELTFGARYDQPDDFDAEWSYRLGSVYSFNKETFAKALFGTAFRVPTYREFRVQDLDGTPKYDEGLSSERMKTCELSIGQNKKNGNSWLLTGFYNKYIDFIADEYVDAVDDEVFYNNKGRTVKGIELSGSYWIEPKLLNLRGSLTCMDHYDDDIHEDLHGVSNWLAFAELTYHATDKLSFAVNGQYASKPHVDANYQSDIPAAQVDSRLNDDYIILGVVATYKYNKNVEFQFIGQNITDTKYYSPHFGPSSNYDYEWPGAEFMFRARIVF